MKKLILFTFLFEFLLISCHQQIPYDDDNSQNKNTSSRIELQVKGDIPNYQNNSRAINPDLSDKLKYKITTENPSGKKEEFFGDSPIISIFLDANIEYKITMDVFIKETEIQVFTGETNFTYLSENPPEQNYIVIPLKGIFHQTSEETGELSVEFALGESISNIKAKLVFENIDDNPYMCTGTTNHIEEEFIINNPTSKIFPDFTPGVYGMQIFLYSTDSGKLLCSPSYIVFSIFPGMTSNVWKGDNEFVTPEGIFEITQEKINRNENSVFFVRGSDFTNLPSENNDSDILGSFTNPLTSIQTALNLCTSSTVREYNIILDGNFEISETISINSPSKVHIRKYNSASSNPIIKRSNDFTNSLFKINEYKDAVFSNIVFEGNSTYSVCEENGGCFNNSGELSLNNCEIKNFQIQKTDTQLNGGAIYSQKGLVSLSHITITQCIASNGNGGAIYIASDSELQIIGTNNIIKDCRANYISCDEGYGGGIYLEETYYYDYYFENLTLDSCFAQRKGGGIFSARPFSLKNSSIINCSSEEESGGGIHLVDSYSYNSTYLEKVTIDSCSAKNEGGGIFSTASFTTNEIKITNCKLTNSSSCGSAICIKNNSTIDIQINLEKSEISDCGTANLDQEEGSALYVNNNGSGYNIIVNVTECLIGYEKNDLTKGTKPSNSNLPASNSSKSNKGKSTIYIKSSATPADKTTVNFYNSKISYNYNKTSDFQDTGTIFVMGGKITLDEESEICANYSSKGASAIYAKNDGTLFSTVEVAGKVHHNYLESLESINSGVLSLINCNATIKDGAEIYDNNFGTSGISYEIGAINIISGTTITFEGGIIQNNYDETKEIYEVYSSSSSANIYIKGITKLDGTITTPVIPNSSSVYSCFYLNNVDHKPLYIGSKIDKFIANIKLYNELSASKYINDVQILQEDPNIINPTNFLQLASENFDIISDNEENTWIINDEGKLKKVNDTVLFVSKNGSDDNSGTQQFPFATIQKALKTCDSFTSNEWLIYLDGTIEVSSKITIDNSLINYTIKSVNSSNKATIKRSASLTDSLIKISAYNNVNFANIIFDGNSDLSSSSNSGSCINNEGELTVQNCIIKDFSSLQSGGAIYSDGGNTTLVNSTIENSTTQNGNGGAIYLKEKTLILSSCTIENCSTQNGNGGAIFIDLGNIKIQGNNKIIGCSAKKTSSGNGKGGAIYIQTNLMILNTIENLIIDKCSASEYGGAIYSEGQINIVNSKITNCFIDSLSGGGGAGIYIKETTVYLGQTEISGCYFLESCTNQFGAAFYAEMNSSTNNITIENSIIGKTDLEDFETGTKPNRDNLPNKNSQKDGANIGYDIIHIQGNGTDTNLYFKNTKISYNYSRDNTIDLYKINTEFDNNTELLANYVKNGNGQINAWVDGTSSMIVDFEGRIHHNICGSFDYIYDVVSAIYIENDDPDTATLILNLKENSYICDNDVIRNPSESSFAAAIKNLDGIINFKCTEYRNNYNESQKCYEVYNNGEFNIMNRGKIGETSINSPYSSIYLPEGRKITIPTTGSDDINVFATKIDVEDYDTPNRLVLYSENPSLIEKNRRKFILATSDLIDVDGTIIRLQNLIEDKFTSSGTGELQGSADDSRDFELMVQAISNSTNEEQKNATITMNDDISLSSISLNVTNGATVEIKPTNEDTPHIIRREMHSQWDYGIEVQTGSTLILSGDLDFTGPGDLGDTSWDVYPNKQQTALSISGTVILENNVKISNFLSKGYYGGTAAIIIHDGGELIINEGATIENNMGYGGAIFIGKGGKLTMNGGTIRGNSGHIEKGNAISIENGGTFIWNGGTIENNTNDTNPEESSEAIYSEGNYINNTANTAS